ncbi:MAG: BlaI/MecI/CopY family transcriptional regulator [Bacteroidales bacterium]|nr:BlaI/MecI/CopY family transcriptional regulator [Bacteroidales bacterium]
MAEKVKNRPQELTKAELEIMQVIWQKEKVLVHDILAELPESKPAYNTVSTIVRILENKGFVSHKAYGRTYEYFPVVAKEDYTLPDGSRLTYPVTEAMVVMQHDRAQASTVTRI